MQVEMRVATLLFTVCALMVAPLVVHSEAPPSLKFFPQFQASIDWIWVSADNSSREVTRVEVYYDHTNQRMRRDVMNPDDVWQPTGGPPQEVRFVLPPHGRYRPVLPGHHLSVFPKLVNSSG